MVRTTRLPLFLLATTLMAGPAAAQQQVDVLIRNGSLVDGTGAPARRADVGILGDRITFVGDAARARVTARRTIEASGLTVTPGFIDPHTHTQADLTSPERRGNVPYLMQGVTTVVTNNDGGGSLEIGRTFDTWQKSGIGTNAALYVPQGSVRGNVMGMSSASPTTVQLDSMRAVVARGMREGALGMSTGLYYAPGSYSTTEEVIELAKVVSQYGGIYDSHMRDESSYTIGLIGSINEIIRISREARIPVNISHIKALGEDVWGQADTVITLVRAARAMGLKVTADQYPYLASGTSVGASLLPRWAEAGGRDSLRARISDPQVKPRLVADMQRNMARRGGASTLLISSSRDTSILGKTLDRIAEARGVSPIEAALQIILAGDASVASFNMKDADIEKFMREPWVMTGSDGSSGHPRKYGTFPLKLRKYVFEKGVLTLSQAVHVSTQRVAETLQISERGVIKVGNFADVVAFDSKALTDRATYVSPTLLAEGVRYVVVNGAIAVDSGKYNGALSGRPLRNTPRDVQRSAMPDFASQVEIRRTAHGVPHINAQSFAAAGYGLAYVQSEDYGARVAIDLLEGRGEKARWFGRDSMAGDFGAKLTYARAIAAYPLLNDDTRAVYEGFAAGVNRYIELHPQEFPIGFAPRFTGYDVLAGDVHVASTGQASRFLARVDPARARRAPSAAPAVVPEGDGPSADPNDGSNAWAFAPSRTRSGRAILLRNPHLQWSAGYYEAHLTVPGKVDFYGDFRIGGPFIVIGGFNRDLGWSTTNNDPLLGQVYAFEIDRAREDHYLLDGVPHPIQRERVSVQYKVGDSLNVETRDVERTPYGPVIFRDGATLYVLRAGMDGDFRAGEQFLRLMRARSLAEWKDAMRGRARLNSSFTYADRAGNILYLWNAAIPSLPNGAGSDTVAVVARSSTDLWRHYVPFDSLPQVLNPKGGYVHNENDAPWYTNMRTPLDPAAYPAYFPQPRLGLRSQLGIMLIDNDRKLSMKDVLTLKHSYRMLLGDRVRDDLVRAVRASNPAPEISRGIDVINKWDKTVAPQSRGGVLFELWWRRYVSGTRADTMFTQSWSALAPMTTPHGIRFTSRAVEAFAWAVREVTTRHGAVDVAWGDVHRVRRGAVDVPVGGCSGDLGCFRVLSYREDSDRKRVATGGDGWILAVEFGERPRAYSVLAYGQSPRAESPFHADQAAMFARGELKQVPLTDAEIAKSTVRRYRPGITP